MAPIRTIFMGSPNFAVPSLIALAESDHFEVPLVVTQPDRRAGRGRSLKPPAVKTAAARYEIPVIQPETLRDPGTIDRLGWVEPDVIVVVSFGEILRRSILELPRHGCLNVHPSLLPAYRGATPIPATILNGDAVGGVSIIKLVQKMDAGPIVNQTSVALDGTETAGRLSEMLAECSAERLPGVICDWVEGWISPVEQDDNLATYTRELSKNDAQINWSWSAEYIARFIRAMDPWPRAWTKAGEQRLTVLSATPMDADTNPRGTPGTLTVDAGRLIVVTGQGILELTRVKPAGKNPMLPADWIRGLRGDAPARFDSPSSPPDPLIFTR